MNSKIDFFPSRSYCGVVRGFTLLETVITTAVLTTGLVAVAAAFSYTTRTNTTNRQRTTATILLYEKMEQFKSMSFSGQTLPPGGSLNADSPANGYFDYVTAGGSDFEYMRLWEVSATIPQSVTIVVAVTKAGPSARPAEMARATSNFGKTF